MAFFQEAPGLGNQYDDDRVVRAFIARKFGERAAEVTPELRRMGELAGGELYALQQQDRLNEPRLVSWDAWGKRVERIEITPLWQRCERIAAEEGLVATAYEATYGELSRILQFAKVYLFDASSDVYTCPLAMTDGAAATLTAHGGPAAERGLPHLLSRDPETFWTSGQWMTERTGGSDVGLSETVAAKQADGRYALSGTKWFTSATTSQMALTLGRPEGNPSGGKGLALFYLETRNADGSMNHIEINRLKDKLGTRKVPTAELTLDGALAIPVAGTSDGIRNITPMLNVTRTWNAVGALAGMRRAIALARDYANKRVQFGAPLADKPLHTDTLAWMQAEFEASFCLTFRVVELLGKLEQKTISDAEHAALRLYTPLMKLTTGKQAVAVVSEGLECFGGAGYVEDTGLPRLLRDAQVLSIWEGTTNVLSLDALRAIAKEAALAPFLADLKRAAGGVSAELAEQATQAQRAAEHAASWLEATYQKAPASVEAGARRFALTLGRSAELVLLCEQATWSKREQNDDRPTMAAKRFARTPIDLIDTATDDQRALAMDLA